MNQARRVITVVAAVTITLMLLTPQRDSVMVGLGSLPSCDAYYPIFDTQLRRLINAGLLLI